MGEGEGVDRGSGRERDLICPYFFVTLCINMLGIYWSFHMLFFNFVKWQGRICNFHNYEG